jgi:ketosteroid isomerase-like protein
MKLLTDDSVLVPAEKPPYIGAKAIREYWFPASGPKTVLTRFTTTVDHIEQSGDLALVRGTQVIEWTTGAERFRAHGNYMTALKRTRTGWRIAVQMAASAPVDKLN